jgi:small-conductance mechanosensitive channel
MVLGGLWHGAGWTFLIWGALHGCYLAVDHGLKALREKLGVAWRWQFAPFAQAATFLAVVVGWVFFRAASLPEAVRVLQGMTQWHAPPADPVVREFPDNLLGLIGGANWGWIVGLLLLAFFAPNSQEIVAWAENRLASRFQKKWRFVPLAFVGFATTAIIFVISITGIRHGASPFIYFNF